MASLHEEYQALLAAMDVDELPSKDMRSVGRSCGLSAAKTLMQRLPGINLYIPTNGHDKPVRRRSDLPGADLLLVADECGLIVASGLLKHHYNSFIYVPAYDQYDAIVERFVLAHFVGDNAKPIAVACHITDRRVYKIVAEADKNRAQKQASKLAEMQLSLFSS